MGSGASVKRLATLIAIVYFCIQTPSLLPIHTGRIARWQPSKTQIRSYSTQKGHFCPIICPLRCCLKKRHPKTIGYSPLRRNRSVPHFMILDGTFRQRIAKADARHCRFQNRFEALCPLALRKPNSMPDHEKDKEKEKPLPPPPFPKFLWQSSPFPANMNIRNPSSANRWSAWIPRNSTAI